MVAPLLVVTVVTGLRGDAVPPARKAPASAIDELTAKTPVLRGFTGTGADSHYGPFAGTPSRSFDAGAVIAP